MLFSVVYMLLHIVQSLTLYGIRTKSAYLDCIIQIIFNGAKAYGGGFRITTFATNDLVNIFSHLFRVVLI